MAKISKALGATLVAIGLATLIGFASFAVRDERYSKAVLLKERNPGNMLYESQYFVAATIRMFLVAGAVAGGLLAVNGVTLLLIGRVAARREGGAGVGNSKVGEPEPSEERDRLVGKASGRRQRE
jgi:hypothetical protein